MNMFKNGRAEDADVGAVVLNTGLIALLIHLGGAVMSAFVPSVARAESIAPPVVIENVRIFDGEQMISASRVVTEGGMILGIGTDTPAPDGAELIDGQGLTLLPGLIDAHVHTAAHDA